MTETREERTFLFLLGLTVAAYPVTLALGVFLLWLLWTAANFGFPFDFPLLAICLGGGHLIVAGLFVLGALGVRLPRRPTA